MNSREVLRSGLPPASSYHAALEEALHKARGSAPRAVDPPWFAHAGYVAAAGTGGSEHLAWERVSTRLADAQRTEKGRSDFDVANVAFAMGFGLGLVDVGCVTLADGEGLYRSLLSDPNTQRKGGQGHSLVWAGIVLLVLVSAAAAFGVHRLRPLLASNDDPRTEGLQTSEELLANSKKHSGTVVASTVPVAPSAGSGWNDATPESFSTRPARRASAPVMRVDAPDRASAVLANLPSAPGPRGDELARRMNSLAPATRIEVLEASAEGDTKVLQQCIDYCLRTSDLPVVLAATEMVARLPSKDATRQLVLLLRHRLAAVQARATDLIKQIAVADSLWPYVSLVRDRNPAVAAAIRGALAAVVGKDHGANLKAWWAALKAKTKAAAKAPKRRR